MRFLSLVLLIFALLLEISLTTVPLVLVTLICLTVVYKENFLFIFAFIFGLFLDLSLFNRVGISSILFIVFLFLILLYQRKFEIKTSNFVLASSFLGSFMYLLILSFHNLIIFQSLTASIIGFLIFKMLLKINGKNSYD